MATPRTEIKLTITGSSGSGKSALALRLQQFLKFEGIDCYNFDECEDDYYDPFKALQTIREKNTVVTIDTVRSLRENPDNMDYCVILNGRTARYANTVKEAWDIIGQNHIGGTYEVHSPTGKDVSEFIPF